MTDPGKRGTGRSAATSRFGRTWWGRAWVEALEHRARLDPNRLPRGAAYARSGSVGSLTFGPGEVQARVEGRERAPYQVRVRVRPFDDGEWAQVLDAIAARASHAAAMLAGRLPEEVAADVAGAGQSLLPDVGEIGPRCTCPDAADPCKHSAAVCYLVAQALDSDPFLVLLLRGRTREEVLAGLRSRRRDVDDVGRDLPDASDPGRHPPERDDEGVDARAAFAAASDDADPPPAPPLPPGRPGRPAALVLDLPPELGALRADLFALAADAAHRAWDLAVGAGPDGGLDLDPDADLARRAEAVLGTAGLGRLVARSGVPERELVRQALAWRHGGAAGFQTLRAEWDPATEGDAGTHHLLQAARSALRQATGLAPHLRRNRLTAAGLQLRLGRDYRWYPYRRIASAWEPAGAPAHDPAVALSSGTGVVTV